MSAARQGVVMRAFAPFVVLVAVCVSGCAEGSDVIGRRGMGGGSEPGTDPSVPVPDAGDDTPAAEPDAAAPPYVDPTLTLGALSVDDTQELCSLVEAALVEVNEAAPTRRALCVEGWFREAAAASPAGTPDELELACEATAYACTSVPVPEVPSSCDEVSEIEARRAKHTSRACAGVTVGEFGACVTEFIQDRVVSNTSWSCDFAHQAAERVTAVDALPSTVSEACEALLQACL